VFIGVHQWLDSFPWELEESADERKVNDMSEAEVKAVTQYRATWGEGPVWWEDRLWYVDINGKAFCWWDPQTGNEGQLRLPHRPGCAVPTLGKAFVMAGDEGFFFLDPSSGVLEPIGDPEKEGPPNNRFNDGKCDPEGRFWAGTISLDKIQGDAALYRLDVDHSWEILLRGLTNSNGMDWSQDQKYFYHIDTPTKKILQWNYDPEKGRIASPKTLADSAALGLEGSPDGMTLDRDGHLWVAFCHGGMVARIHGKTGEVMRQIHLPCIETTSCTFGGKKLETLFVTTGIKKDLNEPDAGKVFAIEGTGTGGLPAHPFKG